MKPPDPVRLRIEHVLRLPALRFLCQVLFDAKSISRLPEFPGLSSVKQPSYRVPEAPLLTPASFCESSPNTPTPFSVPTYTLP